MVSEQAHILTWYGHGCGSTDLHASENSVIEQGLYCAAPWPRNMLIHSMIFYWECETEEREEERDQETYKLNKAPLLRGLIYSNFHEPDCFWSGNCSVWIMSYKNDWEKRTIHPSFLGATCLIARYFLHSLSVLWLLFFFDNVSSNLNSSKESRATLAFLYRNSGRVLNPAA